MNHDKDWKGWIHVLIGIVAIIVTIYAARWTFISDINAKSLTASVISNSALTNRKIDHSAAIKILIDNRPVENPHAVTIKLINDGSKPIMPSDFEDSISIELGNSTAIESASVKDAGKTGLDPKYSVIDKKLYIDPLLLNPGDAIAIELISGGGNPIPLFRTRIAGVKSISMSNPEKNNILHTFRHLILALACLYVILAFLLDPIKKHSGTKWGIRILSAIMLTLSGSIFIAILPDAFQMKDNSIWQSMIFVVPICLLAAAVSFYIDFRNTSAMTEKATHTDPITKGAHHE